MARSKDELKTYVTELCKEKNLDAATTAIAVAAATGDAAALQGITPEQLAAATAPLLDLTVGRQADYSRLADEAKTEKQKAADHFAKLEAWRKTQVLPEVERLRAKVKELEGGTAADDNKPPKGDETVDVDELRKTVKSEMAQDFLGFELERSELQERHWELFKTPLDTRPLIDIISKAANDPLNPRVVSLSQAHAMVHGAKIKELSDAADAKRITDAEKRGEDRGRKAALAATAGRSGAAIPPHGAGAFWDAVNRDPAKTDADKLTATDRENLFSTDMQRELERSEQELETRINQT